jgi:thioredoxin 1
MNKIGCKQFDEKVLQANKPVVVEFFTEWSGSALIIAEMLKDLEKRYQQQLNFIYISCDACKKLCKTYRINKIPTILIFNHGEVIEELKGMCSKVQIEETINTIVT